MYSNDNQASELIARFAAELFALNSGAPIPRRWKHLLARALAAPRRKVGRKRDLERLRGLIAIVADSPILGPTVKRLDRTRQSMAASGRAKRQVATSRSTNVRAVERAQRTLESYLRGEPLTDEESSAALHGFAQALQNRLRASDQAELEARQRRGMRVHKPRK